MIISSSHGIEDRLYYENGDVYVGSLNEIV